MIKKDYTLYLKYIFLAAIIYTPIFAHLDALPIRIWDEARLAINAYEMSENGNLIVTYFDGLPDMWNTKPPLLIWIQAFFIKIFGFNELAVRLPSAIAALFTCVVIMVFSEKYLKSFWFGFITVVVLVTSQGYIHDHATRTGDYDSLLALFTTISGLLFFVYCERQNKKHLYLFFIFTALAVLTKSVTGLLFVPAMFIYSILSKQLIPLLKSKHFYYGIGVFLLLVLGYYFLREIFNPGYLAAVQNNELGGRYLEVVENHKHEFAYYYNNFLKYKLTGWNLLIPLGLVVGLATKDSKIRRLTIFSTLMITTFFLIISTSQTKLAWYDVPLYPFIAILVAVFIYFVFEILRNSNPINEKLTVNVLPYLFLFVIAIGPYQTIFEKTNGAKEMESEIAFYELSQYMKDAVKGRHDVNNKHVLLDGYNAHIWFYIINLNNKDIQTSFKDWTKLAPEDVVFTHQGHLKEFVEGHYNFEIIDVYGNIVTYKIHGEKE